MVLALPHCIDCLKVNVNHTPYLSSFLKLEDIIIGFIAKEKGSTDFSDIDGCS